MSSSVNESMQRMLRFLLQEVPNASQAQKDRLKAIIERKIDVFDDEVGACVLRAWDEVFNQESYRYASLLLGLKMWPVGMEEFVTSNEYLGESISCWPNVLDTLKEWRPYPLLHNPPSDLIIDNSGLGTAKTFKGQVLLAYDYYFMTCFTVPQRIFYGLSPNTPLFFTIQSADFKTSTEVIYEPIAAAMLASKGLRHAGFNRQRTSSLESASGLKLLPLTAQAKALVSKAVLTALLDEANFMDVIARSSRALDGNEYNQAKEVYRTLRERRQSRFVSSRNPLLLGCTIVSSSVKHHGDFVSTLSAETKTPHIYVQQRQWHVNPHKFGAERFYFGIGERFGEIVDSLESINPADHQWFERIPEELRSGAINDPIIFQREYLNIMSGYIRAFFNKPSVVKDSMVVTDPLIPVERNHIVSPAKFVIDHELVRLNVQASALRRTYWHVDLSKSSDRTGVAGAKLTDLKLVAVNKVWKVIPVVTVIFAGTITPSKESDIIYQDVLDFFVVLRSLGVDFTGVTFDQWQSMFAIQHLRSLGFRAEQSSIDRGARYYQKFKELLTAKAINLIDDDYLYRELTQLEFINSSKEGKVDHTRLSTKDMSDAVCGATVNCYLAKEKELGQIYRDNYHSLKHLKLEAQVAWLKSKLGLPPTS